jgi:uncharacterized protein
MTITRRPMLTGLIASLSMPGMMVRSATAQPAPLRFSTGSAGGTFFEYGAAMARLIQERTGLVVTTAASAGSIENLRRIESGAADLALVAMGPAYEAWTASAPPWTGGPQLRKARALVPMYETPFHLATTQATGLRQARALDGRRVGVGPRGGANELIFQKLAEGLGIKPIIEFGDPSQLADKVISGEIDALFFGAGAPVPAYTKIADQTSIQFLPIETEGAASLRRAYPYMGIGTIPAGSYKGQTAPVPTVVLWNFIVASNELDNVRAHAAARAILADNNAARRAHPAAAATRIENLAANTFMPFHEGALQYFREVGVPAATLAR